MFKLVVVQLLATSLLVVPIPMAIARPVTNPPAKPVTNLQSELSPVEPFPLPTPGEEFLPPDAPVSPNSAPAPNSAPSTPASPGVAPNPASQTLSLEISLSRRQLRVFQGQQVLKTYPVAVGRTGWKTPVGNFQVQQLIPKPAWKHPLTGVVIPGGDAENPLGRYWVGFWTDGKNWVGLHGTPTPGSVGRAVSHGCVRMFNRDIAELYPRLSLGTPVRVKP